MRQAICRAQTLRLRELLVLEQIVTVELHTRGYLIVDVAYILGVLQHPLLDCASTHLLTLLGRHRVESITEELEVGSILGPNFTDRHSIPHLVRGGLLALVVDLHLVVTTVVFTVYASCEAIFELGVVDVRRAVHIANHMENTLEIYHDSRVGEVAVVLEVFDALDEVWIEVTIAIAGTLVAHFVALFAHLIHGAHVPPRGLLPTRDAVFLSPHGHLVHPYGVIHDR